MHFSFSERDLDLIQLEELHADSGYSDWFAARIGLEGYEFVSARHSVSATVDGACGETDLLAFFQGNGSKVAVLIEDKISAAFTHRQAERYTERGGDLVRKGEANDFRTALVAPRQYLDSSVPQAAPWHERITLEDIAAWFKDQQGHHFRWRFNAMNAILQKCARNTSASKKDAARFSRAFAQYLKDMHAPNLWHKPGQDPAGPIINFPGSSDRKMMLWWKFKPNQMTLYLRGKYQGLAEELELPVGIDLQLAGENGQKSREHLVASVPPVEFAVPFEEQISVVEDALDAARKLIGVVPRLEALLVAKS